MTDSNGNGTGGIPIIGAPDFGKLTDDQKKAIAEYQDILGALSVRVAKVVLRSNDWQAGAAHIDDLAQELGETLINRLMKLPSLLDLVVIVGGLVGYQMGLAKAAGHEVEHSAPDEAGRIFGAAVRVISTLTASSYAGRVGRKDRVH